MENKPNDGGPAFPVMAGGALHDGASLRDYFAAKSKCDELSRSDAQLIMGSAPPEADSIQHIIWWADAEAKYKYILADAMLAAREVVK